MGNQHKRKLFLFLLESKVQKAFGSRFVLCFSLCLGFTGCLLAWICIRRKQLTKINKWAISKWSNYPSFRPWAISSLSWVAGNLVKILNSSFSTLKSSQQVKGKWVNHKRINLKLSLQGSSMFMWGRLEKKIGSYNYLFQI